MSHDNNFTKKQYLLGKKKRALQKIENQFVSRLFKDYQIFRIGLRVFHCHKNGWILFPLH